MENVWLASAVWLGLALLASIISIRVAMSIALVEIVVGAVAGNVIGLHLTEWVNFLAGFGAILLTFLAGTEIDKRVVRKHFWSSIKLNDFNQRILELESGGHRGRAMDVLQANAIDFARQIDELRCFLVEPKTKGESR